uniref:Uncharacterized protein n=1 Tax=Picea sitchensis TaxID=3332 RepID=A0A6B9XUA9_PICSI|nr:hypothetical protein Q903MT_gene5729 [Picea sitchensis]
MKLTKAQAMERAGTAAEGPKTEVCPTAEKNRREARTEVRTTAEKTTLEAKVEGLQLPPSRRIARRPSLPRSK